MKLTILKVKSFLYLSVVMLLEGVSFLVFLGGCRKWYYYFFDYDHWEIMLGKIDFPFNAFLFVGIETALSVFTLIYGNWLLYHKNKKCFLALMLPLCWFVVWNGF